MATKAKVTVTYAVTFTAPPKATISDMRDAIKQAMKDAELDTDLRVSLTNKETQYGKR